MRFLHVINEVYSRPWLILPSYHGNIRRVVHDRLLVNADKWAADREPGADFSGNAVEVPQMVIDEGIARIPVAGVIVKGATNFERGAGAVSTEEISRDIAEAVQDDEVEALFLDIDSPGGTVGGVPELGEQVYEASRIKPTMAYTDGMMASAAYWIGSAAEEVVASISADVGSIGVYLPWIDETAAFAMEGLTVEIIRNEGADLKGMGFPGTSLTPEMAEQLQAEVNEIGLMFRQAVTRNRGRLRSDNFRGQSFLAEDAQDRGLIDSVMSREDALANLRKSL